MCKTTHCWGLNVCCVRALSLAQDLVFAGKSPLLPRPILSALGSCTEKYSRQQGPRARGKAMLAWQHRTCALGVEHVRGSLWDRPEREARPEEPGGALV